MGEGHWIVAGRRHHALDRVSAATLRQAVAGIVDEERARLRAGPPTVEQALAVSHEQDVLDWSIRTAHPDFVPQVLRTI